MKDRNYWRVIGWKKYFNTFKHLMKEKQGKFPKYTAHGKGWGLGTFHDCMGGVHTVWNNWAGTDKSKWKVWISEFVKLQLWLNLLSDLVIKYFYWLSYFIFLLQIWEIKHFGTKEEISLIIIMKIILNPTSSILHIIF